MKRFSILTLLAICLCHFSCQEATENAKAGAKSQKDYTQLVDTRIGTVGEGLACGYTYVGATYPFGMMQLTPSFFSPHKGIVVNQISGAGCSHMGNFPFIPLNGKLSKSPNKMNDFDPYEKVNASQAGYLSLGFPGNITCETTVSKRSGIAKFTYAPETKEGTIIIGSGISSTFVTNALIKITSPQSCEGYAEGGEFCGYQTDYRIYFAATFNKPAATIGTWDGQNLRENRAQIGGENSGAYFTFDVSNDKTLEYKVAISYVSVENAKENLRLDNHNRDFDQVLADTRNVWNENLGKIEVEGSNEDRIKQFYTHWYHTLIHPNIFNDINGEYFGSDFNVHQVETGRDYYTTFSAWDTYRTQSQILAMFYPKEASDMVQSAVEFANQAGGFGRWVAANIETGVMHGDPLPIIVSNTYAFGGQDFDTEAAWKHMKQAATIPGIHSQNVEVRPGLQTYLEKGIENASLCLEYTSSDYAIGQFALQAMKNQEDGKYFINRAGNWKNLYDPSTNWLRSRNNDDMSWKNPDDDWREATKENYFWMVPYDLPNLIQTMGGKEAASQRLDSLFVRLDAGYDDHYFAAGNEPDFQVPWIYNWTDKPYKTSEVINRIFNEMYTSKPNGLPGNDDCGSMGAWYVYASGGLFPMIPGVAQFTVNAPQFDVVKMHFPKGTLTIKNNSHGKYVQDMTLNGKKHNTTIDWADIEKGGLIEYQLSDQPNTRWGLD